MNSHVILAHCLDQYAKQVDKTHDLYSYIFACTLDIIASTLIFIEEFVTVTLIPFIFFRSNNWYIPNSSVN